MSTTIKYTGPEKVLRWETFEVEFNVPTIFSDEDAEILLSQDFVSVVTDEESWVDPWDNLPYTETGEGSTQEEED